MWGTGEADVAATPTALLPVGAGASNLWWRDPSVVLDAVEAWAATGGAGMPPEIGNFRDPRIEALLRGKHCSVLETSWDDHSEESRLA